MDGGDAVLVGELAHKTKPADTASETSSLPEQKGFRGFVLLDTQDFTGEPFSSLKNIFNFNENDNHNTIFPLEIEKRVKKYGNVWRLREYCLSLQHERNLFRMGAPFGSASDSLK